MDWILPKTPFLKGSVAGTKRDHFVSCWPSAPQMRDRTRICSVPDARTAVVRRPEGGNRGACRAGSPRASVLPREPGDLRQAGDVTPGSPSRRQSRTLLPLTATPFPLPHCPPPRKSTRLSQGGRCRARFPPDSSARAAVATGPSGRLKQQKCGVSLLRSLEVQAQGQGGLCGGLFPVWRLPPPLSSPDLSSASASASPSPLLKRHLSGVTQQPHFNLITPFRLYK